MRSGAGVFFLAVVMAPSLAYGAESKISKSTLPEVVVKAVDNGSLTSPGIQTARAEINRTAGGVSVIDAEAYKKGRASTLQDSLGYTAGVYVQPRFGAEEARLSIRGSGIQRTFHLRGIKLLQDGIPINQADGGGDFQAIDPLALKYIEVFRGANALQYGSTTLGGAVNFVTPTGRDASAIQSRFELGGFNYLREQVSSGMAMGPADYYVSLSEARQDGFRNHAEQWNRRIFTNFGYQFNEHVETRFYLGLADSKSMLPGSITKGQMRQNPKQPNAANVTGNQKRDYDQVQLSNKTTFHWDDQTFEIGSFYVRKDLFHPIFQVIDQLSHDFGASFRYLNKSDFLNRKNILTLGFNPVWNLVYAQQHVNVGGQRGALTADALQRSRNLDLYGEEQFYVIDRLALVGGMQWSFASRKTKDKFISDGDNSGHPRYHAVSPKAGIRYEITENSQVFANFSRSFEPPSFGELSNVTSGGIRDLTPQKASTLEVGTRGDEGRISWDLAWYYSWVDNELLSLNDAAGNPLGTVNAYRTHHQGVELGTSLDLFRGILAKGGEKTAAPEGFRPEDLLGLREPWEGEDRVVLHGIYSWSRFNFSNDPAFSNNSLPGIPAHFFRAELVYEHPCGIYFGPNLEWTPVDYAVDMNHTLFTDPYALLGLKGGYKTRKGFSFFVEAKNLTNEIYAATTGIISNASGADSGQFFPGDGRSVYAGMEFRWG